MIHRAKIEPFGNFPIRLIRTADGLVVTRATHEHKDLLGAQLVGIGDTSLADLEAALRPIVQGDNPQSRDYLSPSFIVVPEFLLAAAGIGPMGDRFTWRFRLTGGEGNIARTGRNPRQRGAAVGRARRNRETSAR